MKMKAGFTDVDDLRFLTTRPSQAQWTPPACFRYSSKIEERVMLGGMRNRK
jgi:hypothetical protein